MNLTTYLNTPAVIQNAAFVQARKDWLSILLHDWYQGAHDMHVPDFLCHHDIFNLSDAQLAAQLATFANMMNRHYKYQYEAVNMLTSLGLPANFVLAAIDQSYNYAQSDSDIEELLWESDDSRGGEFFATPQTGTSILIAYNTMKEMMSLQLIEGRGWFIFLDGEPLYSSTGVNLVWLEGANNIVDKEWPSPENKDGWHPTDPM